MNVEIHKISTNIWVGERKKPKKKAIKPRKMKWRILREGTLPYGRGLGKTDVLMFCFTGLVERKFSIFKLRPRSF